MFLLGVRVQSSWARLSHVADQQEQGSLADRLADTLLDGVDFDHFDGPGVLVGGTPGLSVVKTM